MLLDFLRKTQVPVQIESSYLTESGTNLSNEDPRLVEPYEIISAYQAKITALRMESGYNEELFQQLIEKVLLDYAAYVQMLPATRAENHREPGGLFRFGLETAFLAFRRADGRFFTSSLVAIIRNRERERSWRYAAFLAGLGLSVGRVATQLIVMAGKKHQWNPYKESLYDWIKQNNRSQYTYKWREHTDERSVEFSSLWISARLLSHETLTYIYRIDSNILEALISIIGGNGQSPLGQLIDESVQAIIDQDLAASCSGDDRAITDIPIEHRMLDAIRRLVREKWTVNTAGGRIWVTDQGVYLSWLSVVNDIKIRIRAEGITGMPEDPDTLATLLIEKNILLDSHGSSNGALCHYHKIIIHAPQVPKQPISAVKIAEPSLIGLTVKNIEPVIVEYPDISKPDLKPVVSVQKSSQQNLDLLNDSKEPAKANTTNLAEPIEKDGQLSLHTQQQDKAKKSHVIDDELLRSLNRYGEAGRVIGALLKATSAVTLNKIAIQHPEGLAIAFPEAIKPHSQNLQEFLASCQSQNLIIAGNNNQLIRKRGHKDNKSPEQFVVLSPKLAKYFALDDIPDDSR